MPAHPFPDFAPWLGVFETLRVIDGVPLFVPEHEAELRRAAEALGLAPQLDLELGRRQLGRATGRWRWIVRPGGTETLFTEEVVPGPAPLALSVSPLRIGAQNWDARFKTVSRLTQFQAGRLAATPEVILRNEHGEVAGGTRTNLFWRRGRRLFTPAHEAGCRCGIVRGFVLAEAKVTEGHYSVDDLLNADEIFATNSLLGIVSVDRIEERELGDFLSADKLRTAYAAAVARQVQAGRA